MNDYNLEHEFEGRENNQDHKMDKVFRSNASKMVLF